MDGSCFIDNITVFLEQCGSFCGGSLVIEFDSQDTFLELSVVYDADIFNVDIIACQNRCDRGDSAGFIDDVAVEGKLFF